MRHGLDMADKLTHFPFLVNNIITNQGVTPDCSPLIVAEVEHQQEISYQYWLYTFYLAESGSKPQHG
jgi:hypothetical protein